MKKNKKTVFVALSGGVDSSVAVLLLKKAGYEVVGVYMKCWSEPDASSQCSSERDAADARAVAEKLGIPFYVWDFEKEYRQRVFQYFLNEYAAGRTPNPDVMCNKRIKFGLFLERVLKLDADFVATGHYVRKSEIRNSKFETNYKLQTTNYKLLRAKDRNKDQSYFLWTLTQEHLKYCLFPIGELTKPQVRAIAAQAGLPTATKKDSQGLCFVGPVKLSDFLAGKVDLKPGPIIDSEGKVLGQHKGVAIYTIGQRQGIGIGGVGPFYVVDKNLATNKVMVAQADEEPRFYRKSLIATQLNWVDEEPSSGGRISVKTRYRQPDVEATIYPLSSGKVRVIFAQPQRAITLGQSVVFYQGEELLGGGIIEQSL